MAEVPIYASRESSRGHRQVLGKAIDGELVLRDRRHGETFERVLSPDELLAAIDESRGDSATIAREF